MTADTPEPVENVPKREPTGRRCNGRKKLKRDGEIARDGQGRALFAGYCGNWPGKGTDHVGQGRCSLHGGASLRGEDHPNFKDGSWSGFVDYDEDVLAAVEDIEGDIEVLETLRAERLGQHYQAIKHLAQNEGTAVAQEILEKMDAGQEVDAQLIGQLARVIGASSKGMDRLVARIQSLTNDIADRKGEDPRTFRKEQEFSDDAQERLERLVEGIGGGGE